ncbi:hypothetical protein BT93_I0725 [Corymbia citriodora subsp. variegata]|nr:hypothetical protein BT93_I0725 [Corymbia citriodora subsp. variegata]
MDNVIIKILIYFSGKNQDTEGRCGHFIPSFFALPGPQEEDLSSSTPRKKLSLCNSRRESPAGGEDDEDGQVESFGSSHPQPRFASRSRSSVRRRSRQSDSLRYRRFERAARNSGFESFRRFRALFRVPMGSFSSEIVAFGDRSSRMEL